MSGFYRKKSMGTFLAIVPIKSSCIPKVDICVFLWCYFGIRSDVNKFAELMNDDIGSFGHLNKMTSKRLNPLHPKSMPLCYYHD